MCSYINSLPRRIVDGTLNALPAPFTASPSYPFCCTEVPPTDSQPLPAALQPFHQEDLMNLTISGHHLEVTPALREYVLTKLDRVTRHFDQVVDITVLLTVEKQREKERRQKAEVTLHVKGRDIYVEHASEDLYAAIDTLMDKLDRQVMRHKDRIQDHHHDSPKRVDASA
jgi:putative sigma-54 modulation protein